MCRAVSGVPGEGGRRSGVESCDTPDVSFHSRGHGFRVIPPMSQPPPPYPVPGENDRDTRAPTPAFGAGGYTPFAVPAHTLQYDSPETGTRPGLITAVAVMSIVIASLSGLASIVSG